jgi:hypothetical protein
MLASVLDQVVALREGAFAVRALVRLLARVDAAVARQVILAREPVHISWLRGGFCVMRIGSRTRDRSAWVKFHTAGDTQFRVSIFCGVRDGFDNR